jgi:hypothetical protein
MAVLIPRKQIEEQNDISGSFRVGGDLSVSGSTVIGGSFAADSEFFLGNQLTDRGEITGSVFLTGSLLIDGDFDFTDANKIINVTASQALQSQDTFRYAGILARDFGANVPTLYVSSTDGDDNNDGRSIQFPLRTVKRAAQLASPGFDGRYGIPLGSLFSGYVIRVQAGTYVENNPVILPKNTTIWGSGLRITKINALNPEQDLFHVNSGCYIAEVTMGGLRLWPDQINPERGFAVAFQPGAFITTSPYIQNCSQISNQENSFTELYEDIPPGGGGLYVNGDVINPDSPLASMVLDAYTQISPNGVGCLVNGRGFIQLVSFFTNFSYYAIRVNNGGHATLNNSNISFGLFGMFASGSRKIDAISGGNEDARRRVRASYSAIVDVLNKGLEEGLPSVTTVNTAEGIKVTQFTQSFSNDLATQTEVNKVSEDFRIVSEIVASGPNNYPTLLAKSSDRGYDIDNPYNISGGNQVSSSISASASDLLQISSSYVDLLGIFADGTGSFIFKSNNEDAVKVSNLEPVSASITASAGTTIYNNISSSFDTVIKIVNGGRLPTIVTNTSASLYLGDTEPVLPSQPISSSIINVVSSSFSIIYNILDKGTGSSILDIPEDHQTDFDVFRGSNNSAWVFDGVGNNPTLTLFRGTTYRFSVSGSFAKFTNPFFIRTEARSGFIEGFDYNDGVINNGDDFGNITFTVPFNAPNELYYVSQNSPQMVGKFNIVNSSATPFELIENTMSYPTRVNPSLTASIVGDVTSSYNTLNSNLDFLKNETITYISSSWAGFEYNETTCKRDIGYIVDAVANDLLFGGNSGSITAGLEYYLVSSSATTSQKDATLTAIDFLSKTSQNLLRSSSFQQIQTGSSERYALWSSIIDSKPFIQTETITYLSSSWSEFEYNEVSCSRDIGFILNAVATDLLYGGNERSVIAGDFYYRFPSVAVTDQLIQTVDGIKYASGTTLNIVEGNEFQFAENSTSASVSLLRQNRQLIQNETIEFINATFPTLDYNQEKCRRDTGFILDAIITDLLYGGNERSITAGFFYYRFPSIATSRQRIETVAGIRYSKILADFIVQNRLLETPRVSTNNEVGIKITDEANFTSSLFGTQLESSIVKSNFGVIGDIIKGGIEVTKRAVAKNKITDWNVTTPFNVADGVQFVTTQSLTDYRNEIGNGFEIVATIVSGGLSVAPQLDKSINDLVKVNDIAQLTGSFVENYVTSSISASFGLVVNIISKGTGSIPNVIPNTDENIFVGNILPQTGSFINPSYISSVSQSYSVVTNIVSGGLAVSPVVVKNTNGNVRTQNVQLFTSSLVATNTEVDFVSASFNIVLDIVENGTGSLPTLVGYETQSSNPIVLNAYQNLKNNIPFIQAETIAYLSSSWSEFVYNEASCSRDIGFIVSGAAEDLLYNANSSSIVNGKFYYDFPSSATVSGSASPNEEAQLLPTLDGIRYASQLAQKVIVNTPFVTADESDVEVANLLVSNKEFIRNETIEYISSSWSFFNYNDELCKRDIGFIIDAIATDLIYGGNERVVNAGEYYYDIPSEATSSQLIQTLEAINYVSALSQKLIGGEVFVPADTDALEASRILLANNNLISSEVVSYVSSSWSGVVYDETKCKRDVKHIIDAARTDLVYGGNQRSVIAGEFYFLHPSRATVGGIPSEAAQLDPTVTGIEYGSELSQQIALSKVLTLVSSSKLDVVNVVRENKQFIKDNTIEYVNSFYPFLQYNEASCSRDVGFILDGVLTDLVYGGNQRSITSGDFYYRFPSPAITSAQKAETVDGILYAGAITKLVSVNELIDGVEIGRNIDNTIKVTNTPQFTSSQSGSVNEISNISSSFDLIRGIINDGIKSFTPTTATYNPANGDFVMTIPSHSLTTENGVYLRPESFVFTCDMDGNRTEHALPSVGQPAYDSRLQIQSVTNSTVTVNVGKSGPNLQFTPTNATYDPANGDFVITIGSHDLSVGEGIVITTGSIAFTCDMDDNQSVKSYPRFGIDPFAGRSMMITDTTPTTITVNVGASGPNRYFTPTSASYNALTGDMVVTVGQHGLGVGRGVVLENNSIAFTCDQDGNTTTHSYPRSGSDPYAEQSIPLSSVGFTEHTVTNAPYNAETGDVTITIVSHSFSNGDYIKLSDNSLTYTCVLDGNTVSKSYPRPGYDYPSGRWLSISNITTNTFDINIGTSSYTNSHTFVTASANGLQRQDGTFTINVGDAGSASGSIHTFVSASANAIKHEPQSLHTFVSASVGAIKHLPQSVHTFVRTTQNSVSTIPVLSNNNELGVKITNISQITSSVEPTANEINKVSSSFSTVLDIIEYGTETLPVIVNNTIDNVKVTNTPQITFNASGSISEANIISASFAIVLDIVKNGTGSIPTIVDNIEGSIRITNETQFSSSISASQLDIEFISSSFGIVLDIVENGTGSHTASNYGVPSTDVNTLAAYSLLKDNIPFIQEETITYISSSWSDFEYDEDKCKRDVGFIVSGAAEDLLHGVASASVVNGKFYYEYPSEATSSQLVQTLDGIRYASKLSEKIIQNIIFVTASFEVSASNVLLNENKQFIKDETIAYLSSSWSNFSYNQDTCKRDIGFIVDAVRTDLVYGGNERSSKAGEFYYLYPSAATVSGSVSPTSASQLFPTLDGIHYAGRLSEKVIQNIVFETASIERVATGELLINNIILIKEETIAYLSSSWSDFDYNQDTCKRDIGFIVDAVRTDVVYGGNERSITAGDFYYRFPSSATVSGSTSPTSASQLYPTLDGIRYASRISDKIIQNSLLVTASLEVSASNVLLNENKDFIKEETIAYLSSSWSDFSYNQDTCKRDIGFIIDAVRTDLVYGGNERSVTAGDFYYRFPSAAIVRGTSSPTTAAQLFPTLDGIRYAGDVSQKLVSGSVFQTASLEVSASANLLRKNRRFIQREVIEYVSSSWSQVVYNEASCSRDVGFLLDAATTDLLYGGEERSINAGDFYYRFPSRATVAGVPSEAAQLDPTLTGVRYAGGLASKIVLNQQFTFPSQSVLNGRSLLLANKQLVQKETIAFLSSSWSGLNYNEVSCSRDLGFIIDAVSTDLVYGGNESSIQAGTYYYIKPSVAIIDSYADNFGQKQQTVDGINFAKGVSEKVVAQTQLVFPGVRRLEAAQRLVAAKEELKRRALSYTNGAFPALVYNEASCSRDTGLIVDALATDLIYGGNERGIEAATSYFTGQYGSAAEVVNNQRLETLETNRYLRTRAEFIAANAPQEDFGSLIVATGIDYSYNGSGVTFKALPPNQGGSGIPNPDFEITELGGGRIFFTSGNQDGDFRIGTGLSINQATGTLVGRTFSKSLFSLVTPFSLALEG